MHQSNTKAAPQSAARRTQRKAKQSKAKQSNTEWSRVKAMLSKTAQNKGSESLLIVIRNPLTSTKRSQLGCVV
jgi:hypothetical protein